LEYSHICIFHVIYHYSLSNMPNIKQIISLRERYAPVQKVNDSFSVNETKNYIEGQELKKAFASESFRPLFENINQTKYFSVTAKQQIPEIVKYFENNQKEWVVLLFIDITNFSTKTSKLSPEKITSILDDYYNDLFPIIYKHGGEIEKVMGDGIICIFGKPFLNTEDRVEKYNRAQSCARDIIVKFKETSNSVKIALHNGEVMYYKTPTSLYEEYTMIGKALTELYRLESISVNNSINFFAGSYYDQLIDKSKIKTNFKNSSFWTYYSESVKLKGLGSKTLCYFKRVK